MKTARELGASLGTNKARVIIGVALALALMAAATLAGPVMAKPQQQIIGPSDLPQDSMMGIRINIDGITGAGEWIEVDSFQWGVVQSGGGGGGAGKATFEDLQVSSHLSHFSPKIVKAVATGEHVKKVVLEDFSTPVKKSNETVYLQITLEDVLISSYHVAGESGDDTLPMESMSFSYAKISFTYIGPDPAMKSSFTYDLESGKSA
jgi:type VI secretion system secreted protein Hcp